MPEKNKDPNEEKTDPFDKLKSAVGFIFSVIQQRFGLGFYILFMILLGLGLFYVLYKKLVLAFNVH